MRIILATILVGEICGWRMIKSTISKMRSSQRFCSSVVVPSCSDIAANFSTLMDKYYGSSFVSIIGPPTSDELSDENIVKIVLEDCSDMVHELPLIRS